MRSILNLALAEETPVERAAEPLTSFEMAVAEVPFAGFSASRIPGGYPSSKSLLTSCVLHAIATAGLGAIHFAAPAPEKTLSASATRATEILIGDRLYYVTEIPSSYVRAPRDPKGIPSKTTSHDGPPQPATKPPEIQPPASAGEATTPSSAPKVPRVFVPREVVRDQYTTATLIQPNSPADLTPTDSPLPSFRIWTATLPRYRRAFVTPGTRIPQPAPPKAPPPPVPEFQELHVDAPPPLVQARLTLPAPPPSIVNEEPPKVTNTPQPIPLGDPVNVLSMSDRSLPVTDRVVVPPGNVAGRSGDGIDGRGAGTARPSPEGPSSPSPVAASGGEAKGPVIITRPANGSFDSVLVQTTPLDQFPDGKKLLSGRPIYTVFIAIGTAKEWPMYFCVPGDQSGAGSPQDRVVRLDTPAPVKPPYPTRMVRPDITIPAYQKYVLVHGFVTEEGKVRDARVVPPVRAETGAALVASLNGWVFRPAERNNSPVAVEFILAVPAVGL